ncbi:MAG: cytochrome c-type biogenesis protein CcmH [ANME-2 cluster archaeon]|nr:cytochrome c-type biogenesis protein CcmH [ANME-2 cluster archaeon]
MKKILATIHVVLLMIPVLMMLAMPAAAADSPQVVEITSNLKCQCGCTMIVTDCNCQEAADIRNEVSSMVQQGMSSKQIIRELKFLYGNEILATPEKTGFDLSLWILPGVGVMTGGLLIYFVLSRNKMSEEEIFEMEYQEYMDESSLWGQENE